MGEEKPETKDGLGEDVKDSVSMISALTSMLRDPSAIPQMLKQISDSST